MLLAFFLFLAPGVSGAAAPPAAREPNLRALQATILAELAETGTPGAAVAVVSGDRVLFARGFGVASVETGETVTPGHLFHVGSVTKMLTATALASLAEQGKIRLDAPIGTYAKGLDPAIARLTLHQLLSQTSGLRDIPGEDGLHDESALGEAARSLRAGDVLIETGRVFSYSNPGYGLAGYVLEQATGKPYAEAMRDLVFAPLGMSRTTLRPTAAMTWPLALGHAAEGEAKPAVVRPMADDTRFWPAGYAFASLDDLARFTMALLGGGVLAGRQVLPAGATARLLTPHAEIPTNVFTDGRYGYGLILQVRGALRVAEHGGELPGYNAEIRMVPERRLAVITLMNREGIRFEKTFARAFELILGERPSTSQAARPELPLSTEEMSRLAGTYANRWSMEVFVRDGRLYLRRFGSELPITRIGENRYSVRPEGAPQPQELLIVPPAGGRAGYLQMFIWAFRREEPPSAPP